MHSYMCIDILQSTVIRVYRYVLEQKMTLDMYVIDNLNLAGWIFKPTELVAGMMRRESAVCQRHLF